MFIAPAKRNSEPVAALLKGKLTTLSFIGALVSTTEVRATGQTVDDAEVVLAQLVDDIGAAARVEAAVMLRTLSQEVASAACYLYSGIDVEESKRLALEAREKFDTNLDALMNGNPAMNIIGGEKRPKTIKKLDDIKGVWTSVSAALTALVADTDDSDAVGVIKSTSMDMFYMTDMLVSEISGEYSNPAELLQVDAIMLDIVGRQGMLTQKIAKNACKVWNKDALDASTQALTDAMTVFETSLNALINGMPSLGVLPAPTPEIQTGLTSVVSDWNDTRPFVDELLNTGALASEDQSALFRRMNDKMYRLEKITHDYALYSKHKYD